MLKHITCGFIRRRGGLSVCWLFLVPTFLNPNHPKHCPLLLSLVVRTLHVAGAGQMWPEVSPSHKHSERRESLQVCTAVHGTDNELSQH